MGQPQKNLFSRLRPDNLDHNNNNNNDDDDDDDDDDEDDNKLPIDVYFYNEIILASIKITLI